MTNCSKNLALFQPTSQSSVCYGGDPERAVDGNNNPDFRTKSCTHTCFDPIQHWWQLDLTLFYFITHVKLTNRNLGGIYECLPHNNIFFYFSILSSILFNG